MTDYPTYPCEGVVQDVQGVAVQKLPPDKLTLVRSLSDSPLELEPLLAKVTHRRPRRAGSVKRLEEQA